MRNGQTPDPTDHHLRILPALAGVTLVGVIVAPNRAQPNAPVPYMSAESNDLDVDAAADTVLGAPAEQTPEPREVYNVSGSDSIMPATLHGSSDGDSFGYSVAVADDGDLNTLKDLIRRAQAAKRQSVFVTSSEREARRTLRPTVSLL